MYIFVSVYGKRENFKHLFLVHQVMKVHQQLQALTSGGSIPKKKQKAALEEMLGDPLFQPQEELKKKPKKKASSKPTKKPPSSKQQLQQQQQQQQSVPQVQPAKKTSSK